MVYCVRAEAEGEGSGGSGVAVNSRVGSGVSVGGAGVNVYTASVGATDIPAGWNGVGLGEASGLGVTSTIVGRFACTYTGNEQAVKTNRITMAASRRGCFMYVIAR